MIDWDKSLILSRVKLPEWTPAWQKAWRFSDSR